jgi:hypothetical protein
MSTRIVPTLAAGGALAALIVVGALSTTRPVAAQNTLESGILRCDVSAGIGLIVGSNREMNCVFERNRGPVEYYAGSIQRYGLDLGATAGGVMLWSVLSSTEQLPRGAMAGTYVGGSAEASAVAGLGANALVGGSGKAVSLQPLSIQGQVGINVAAGVAQLTLRSAQAPR